MARDGWEALFRGQGMRNPQPRMRMLDGFNEGWIAFPAGPGEMRRGSTTIGNVVSALVRSR